MIAARTPSIRTDSNQYAQQDRGNPADPVPEPAHDRGEHQAEQHRQRQRFEHRSTEIEAGDYDGSDDQRLRDRARTALRHGGVIAERPPIDAFLSHSASLIKNGREIESSAGAFVFFEPAASCRDTAVGGAGSRNFRRISRNAKVYTAASTGICGLPVFGARRRANKASERTLACDDPLAGEPSVRYSHRAIGARRPSGNRSGSGSKPSAGTAKALAANLSPEDQAIQSMPDVSPTKWHLAHTSWFFETFVLGPLDPGYRAFDPAFAYLFNSYYEAVGPRHPRPERGLLSRPTVDAIGAYRDHVTAAVLRFADEAGDAAWREAMPLIELGLNHEQQHQELMLMDIKHVFSVNPLLPAYQAPRPNAVSSRDAAPGWVEFAGGLCEIGHDGGGFAFDNEGPRHKVWLEPYRLASHPVTCGEYLDFISDGGYRRPEFWLSEGWACVQQQGWQAPLYWRGEDGEWRIFTLAGERRVEPAEPVCHVSFYEADAFARWAGRRLPTEAEWENAAADLPLTGNLADSLHYHPCPDDHS